VTLERIAGFCLVAADGEALAGFYQALGFALEEVHPIAPDEMALLGIAGGGVRRSMRLGDARLHIDRYDRPGRPCPAQADAASPGFQHFALVTDDAEAAWARALGAGATAISRAGPVALPAGAGGVTAVKFRDPEGHPLELIRFPDAARRGWGGRGILGIDHSAVSVADAARSCAFYRGHGLAPGDATLNHGPAQDALDGLDGVRVDVVPMRPARQRPHVELLHYRAPRAPAGEAWDTRDGVATRIVWQGDGPALLRDPDGHLHQVGAGGPGLSRAGRSPAGASTPR
jgi:catechol 2,3-dioxygenase-like lactoylglutathione lyase family enzyme